MAHDPLDTLVKLRRTSQDGAQQALARAISAETAAATAAANAERSIVEEQRAALDLAAGDGVVEAFGAWLPAARARAAAAWEACERARAEVARTRAALTAARTAVETVETLMDQRAKTRRDLTERRLQADLDGMAPPSNDPADQT